MLIEVPNVALLGMVFSKRYEPERGQLYRDRERCEEMNSRNFRVISIDNAHEDLYLDDIRKTGKNKREIFLENHVCGDFSNTRRLFKSIRDKFGSSIRFKKLFLDYFFSPVSRRHILLASTIF
jgi:hypothetical protein